MRKFPPIEQFRNVIRTVTDRARYAGRDENGEPIFDTAAKLPTMEFRGTIKLHGTNAGIVYDALTGEIQYQSRERIITPEDDNAGFAAYFSQYEDELRKGFGAEYLVMQDSEIEQYQKIAIYGEWCGGNIQKGVAITGLPKMFVIFAVRYIPAAPEEESRWVDVAGIGRTFDQIPQVYEINQFGTMLVKIDFANPGLIQNTLIELTEKVEAECPAGKYFGVSGVGEGIVWTAVEDPTLRFKVKGEKHSVSKVKTLAAVDVEAIKAIEEFLDYSVTEARLQQGIDKLREMGLPFEMKSMGEFIRWVYNDVVREEADTIEASGFDAKKLGGPIANRSRPWFITTYNSQA